MSQRLDYPFDASLLLRKKKSIRRELMARTNLIEKRIAILGGSTTAEVKDMLELFLLNQGIRPVFYESGYNLYYEEAVFANAALRTFSPEIIYIHSSNVNIAHYPAVLDGEEAVNDRIVGELARFREIWDHLSADYACPIIQNNFELPHYRGLGNLDSYAVPGRTHFVSELNRYFAAEAGLRGNLHLNDINYLSAWFGLARWYDKTSWYSYKYAMNIEAIPLLAHSAAAVIGAVLGRSKKCLVLDLDNTLWGGEIGEDGINGIRIGKDNAESEAYSEFQQYIKELGDRGVILAVCSKNDEVHAREGFTHPDSILALDDFSDFRANWQPKPENIHDVAEFLNIGMDSLVFADDNPVERDIVRAHEPQVAVPELGDNVTRYIDILDKSGYFETTCLSVDDVQRRAFYSTNEARLDVQHHYENYDDYLLSLEMCAEIKAISPIYLERATQLTNKTNQFNLTTRRYTQSEIEAIMQDSGYITRYGRLRDKFGDNGLVSVLLASIRGAELHIDLWIMSCRVFKRTMEAAMLDQLVVSAQELGISSLVGHYFPTAKNGIVSDLFKQMGFELLATDEDGASHWELDISRGYAHKNIFIGINT